MEHGRVSRLRHARGTVVLGKLRKAVILADVVVDPLRDLASQERHTLPIDVIRPCMK